MIKPLNGIEDQLDIYLDFEKGFKFPEGKPMIPSSEPGNSSIFSNITVFYTPGFAPLKPRKLVQKHCLCLGLVQEVDLHCFLKLSAYC
jgi:hypothetical protein